MRRTVDADPQLLGVPDPSLTPSEIVSGRDLLERARAVMTPEERSLADRRVAGHSWEEIARELGGNAAARRKQYSRTLARVAPLLGLDADEAV